MIEEEDHLSLSGGFRKVLIEATPAIHLLRLWQDQQHGLEETCHVFVLRNDREADLPITYFKEQLNQAISSAAQAVILPKVSSILKLFLKIQGKNHQRCTKHLGVISDLLGLLEICRAWWRSHTLLCRQ